MSELKRNTLLGATLILIAVWSAVDSYADEAPSLGSLASSPAASGQMDEATFRSKLRELLARVDQSIHLLREQITESQSEPFLADLYVQLAELLSQKSNALYYVQKEKDPEASKSTGKGFGPVVEAQKEAIGVYEMLLREFPNFDRKAQIHFRLALSHKSIDEIPAFIKEATGVIRSYPGSDEALRSQLLLGQHFAERGLHREAVAQLKPVTQSALPYERNLARYRIGLVELARENHREALNRFEEVALDPELKDQNVPGEVSLKSREVKADLKKEALIDSIRAYTSVFKKDAKPVQYYQRIAPTELHFQEVMEKLAMRYIYLKNYEASVGLLRSLSERTADTQKIINIYRQVLTMIPVKDRAEIPVAEMRFLLEKYNLWSSFYELKPALRAESRAFFEKQVRELATRNHELGKFARASEYYRLYLGWFGSGPERSSDAAKMAANLATVEYSLGHWIESGEYAVRAASGEFGPVGKDATRLLEGAVGGLQKTASESFYDTFRRKGLLIRALDLYVAQSPARTSDPKLGFLLVKTRYEQGLFPEALDGLFQFAGRFRQTPQAVQAGELILNHFNTRNDSESLAAWSTKLLTLHLADRAFNRKLATIEGQAETKLVKERAEKAPGFDTFAQGRSYLNTALASRDGKLSAVALREALARSRNEKDLGTYFETARLLGAAESDPHKKAEILSSVAAEDLRLTRYRDALSHERLIYQDQSLPSSDRHSAFERSVRIALQLRDWHELTALSRSSEWKSVSPAVMDPVRVAWNELLESPVRIPEGSFEAFAGMDSSEEGRLALFHAQPKLSFPQRAVAMDRVSAGCSAQKKTPTCAWLKLAAADSEREKVAHVLETAEPKVDGVQAMAGIFAEALKRYQVMESGAAEDSRLQIGVLSRERVLYRSFASYLERVGQANPELAGVIGAKVRQSQAQGGQALKQCESMAGRVLGLKSTLCSDGVPSQDALLAQGSIRNAAVVAADPESGSIQELQRKLFENPRSTEALLSLGRTYFENGNYPHALAVAGIGSEKGSRGEFLALRGCSALRLGYLGEAGYALRDASSFEGLKERCQSELKKETL